uniref:B9 domain-containing protein 2 n=1 Tax=Spumella elongata TaxID=89044 RepID=A0A7S3M057_9STRA
MRADMPTVNFVGEIASSVVDVEEISVTWAIVPGNSAWYLKRGASSGETHTCQSSSTVGTSTISHPIDCQFASSSSEGWPIFVCEVWERSEQGFRGFRGCGSVWLPMAPGQHFVDVPLWKPISSGLEGLSEELIPTIPDLTALRELTMSPFLRSQINTATVGTLQLNLSTILSGFKAFGVSTC